MVTSTLLSFEYEKRLLSSSPCSAAISGHLFLVLQLSPQSLGLNLSLSLILLYQTLAKFRSFIMFDLFGHFV